MRREEVASRPLAVVALLRSACILCLSLRPRRFSRQVAEAFKPVTSKPPAGTEAWAESE